MGANGENPKKVLTSENEEYSALAWSPTGQRLAYIKPKLVGYGGSIETVSLDGGQPSVVISDSRLGTSDGPSLLWVRDGRLIYDLLEPSGNSNLWEIMTDPRTGMPSGKPAKITSWAGLSPSGPSVSRDGSRLVVTNWRIRDDVYVGELKEKGTRLDSPKRLTVSDSTDYPSAWTRDSRTIQYNVKVFFSGEILWLSFARLPLACSPLTLWRRGSQLQSSRASRHPSRRRWCSPFSADCRRRAPNGIRRRSRARAGHCGRGLFFRCRAR
jgi:Tol biopolymer transport system component